MGGRVRCLADDESDRNMLQGEWRVSMASLAALVLHRGFVAKTGF